MLYLRYRVRSEIPIRADICAVIVLWRAAWQLFFFLSIDISSSQVTHILHVFVWFCFDVVGRIRLNITVLSCDLCRHHHWIGWWWTLMCRDLVHCFFQFIHVLAKFEQHFIKYVLSEMLSLFRVEIQRGRLGDCGITVEASLHWSLVSGTSRTTDRPCFSVAWYCRESDTSTALSGIFGEMLKLSLYFSPRRTRIF